jgi:hypothetical protein
MVKITGYTERQIYRARARLRERGAIGWTLDRAPGAAHDHAVYAISEDY